MPAATIMSFKVDPETAGLSLINKQPAIGANPASVCVSPDEKYLFTANHGNLMLLSRQLRPPTEDGSTNSCMTTQQ